MSAGPDFDNLSLWDVRRDVTVFDEHFRPEKTRGDGKKVPARDFKKADLEAICKNCNERDAKGLHAAVTIGHTTDAEDETEQPEIVGYDRNFRVEYDERLKKHVIKSDRFLRRERVAEAEKYPRTSVEHWMNQDFFDPIALVRRTPKCDIPQWHYARRRGSEISRYTMEGDMADPTEAPDAAAPNPELEAMVMKCVMSCLEKMKMTAPAAASPTNGAPPAAAAYAAPTTDVDRFASEAEKIRYTRQQGEIDRLKKESEEMRATHARAGAEAQVKQLLYEGYDLDPEYEVQELMSRDVGGREKYLKNVRDRYQRAPAGGEMLRTWEPPGVERHQRRADDGPTEAETDLAVKHMRKSGEADFDTALKHVRERKTA